MQLSQATIRNFRRLEKVTIDFEDHETVFVGPNNSGKTSATAIFRSFLDGRDFKIHDFSVACSPYFDKFVASGNTAELPKISLDLWFSIDPATIAFGRVFTLLPNLSDLTKVGIRLSFGHSGNSKLHDEYSKAYPADANTTPAKTLYQYLATDGNLGRHFSVQYASLEEKESAGDQVEVVATPLEFDEGRRLIKQLVLARFVDAQRNITDEDTSRSNRLSAAFASFYRKNLEQVDHAAAANKVIDENNASLTRHYETQFDPLLKLIKSLGVPSVNDRSLRLVSSLSPETALRGSTELLYVDSERKHELPELYNGLGFKNLIYMAIQARHYHSQWLMTDENRPLCFLIFIEEPEVHLHAQVQQTFISNIWSVINDSARTAGQPALMPQLVVTTHSSHILDAVEYEKVRYFQRCFPETQVSPNGVRNASKVLSLRSFKPDTEQVGGATITPANSLAFLRKYLRLTHCDLFFADAAILVEGAVEKLLLPSMIDKAAGRLRSTYLSVLEVGGAYAHRFEGLLAFLHIPYLIITDLDSVEPQGKHLICRADQDDALTSNATLKKLFGIKTVKELIALSSDQKIDAAKSRRIAFQIDTAVVEKNAVCRMRPRTLEESIAYQNFALLRTENISLGIKIPDALEDAYERIYDHIRSGNFKKTDFAMDLLACDAVWAVPAYIDESLKWLESRLCGLVPMANPVDVSTSA